VTEERLGWYPSLQPLATPEDIAAKHTSMKLDKKARLFFKYSDLGRYFSTYQIEFEK
jgi:hypothetical protein